MIRTDLIIFFDQPMGITFSALKLQNTNYLSLRFKIPLKSCPRNVEDETKATRNFGMKSFAEVGKQKILRKI